MYLSSMHKRVCVCVCVCLANRGYFYIQTRNKNTWWTESEWKNKYVKDFCNGNNNDKTNEMQKQKQIFYTTNTYKHICAEKC